MGATVVAPTPDEVRRAHRFHYWPLEAAPVKVGIEIDPDSGRIIDVYEQPSSLWQARCACGALTPVAADRQQVEAWGRGHRHERVIEESTGGLLPDSDGLWMVVCPCGAFSRGWSREKADLVWRWHLEDSCLLRRGAVAA